MSRSRILSSLAAASLGVALLGACSAESLTERAVGFGLEQAIEGDQDIDLDFSDDGTGGFSISTEEGDFAINFDEDSGGIVFDTDEGSGVISLDENGIVYDTDEGEGVISFDEDNGTITFDTDEGSGQINVDDDAGTVSVTTDDGEFGMITNGEVPANWPREIGFPTTLVPGSQAFTTIDMGDGGAMVTGTFEHADNDPYAQNAVAALEASGWTASVTADQDGFLLVTLSKDNTVAQVMGEGGMTSVILQDINGG